MPAVKVSITILDYGNTQLTNEIPSLEVTSFASYLFRGNYFAALRHFLTSWQPRLQFERRRASRRQTELLERFVLTKTRVLGILVGSGA